MNTQEKGGKWVISYSPHPHSGRTRWLLNLNELSYIYHSQSGLATSLLLAPGFYTLKWFLNKDSVWKRVTYSPTETPTCYVKTYYNAFNCKANIMNILSLYFLITVHVLFSSVFHSREKIMLYLLDTMNHVLEISDSNHFCTADN